MITTSHVVPFIAFQRATVAFDDFCREVHEHFSTTKNGIGHCDLMPGVAQLLAMLLDRVECYIVPLDGRVQPCSHPTRSDPRSDSIPRLVQHLVRHVDQLISLLSARGEQSLHVDRHDR